MWGTREAPSIGGVPWSGSIYLDSPEGLEGPELLAWRLEHDLVWTLASLIQITSKDTNRSIPFHLNRPQAWVMWNVVEQTAVGEPAWQMWLKGRQFGYSTLASSILAICTWFRGANSLLLSYMEAPGKTLFRRVEGSRDSLPSLEFDTDPSDPDSPKQVIELVAKPSSYSAASLMSWVSKNKNAMIRRESAENRNAGVGETWQNVQITEEPLFPDAAQTVGHLLPALSPTPGTHVLDEFTARTEGDYTHKKWLQAIAGDGDMRAVFSAWYWHTPYARPKRVTDKPFSQEEETYREWVAQVGSEYPLTDDGCLIPRLQAIYDEKGFIHPDDLQVGFQLSDEQLLFRRAMISGFAGDRQLWRTEFPATWVEAFATAGRKLIDGMVMDRMELTRRDPFPQPRGRGEYESHAAKGNRAIARWQPHSGGRCHRFELPRADAAYVGFLDPSSGTGVDPSGGGMLRVSYQRIDLVASFEGMERPHNAARILARMGRHYRSHARFDPKLKRLVGGVPALLAIERNTYGEHVIYELDSQLKYRNLARYEDRTKDNWKRGHAFGFPTTNQTKNPMLLHLAKVAYDDQLFVPCARTLTSLRGMQYLEDDGGKTRIGAPKGQHDDLAMGIGIGVWFATQLAEFRFPAVEAEPEWLVERRQLAEGYRHGQHV